MTEPLERARERLDRAGDVVGELQSLIREREKTNRSWRRLLIVTSLITYIIGFGFGIAVMLILK